MPSSSLGCFTVHQGTNHYKPNLCSEEAQMELTSLPRHKYLEFLQTDKQDQVLSLKINKQSLPLYFSVQDLAQTLLTMKLIFMHSRQNRSKGMEDPLYSQTAGKHTCFMRINVNCKTVLKLFSCSTWVNSFLINASINIMILSYLINCLEKFLRRGSIEIF